MDPRLPFETAHATLVRSPYAQMPLINARAVIYIRTMCMRAAKALANLRISADSPEPSLLANAISTESSCTGSFEFDFRNVVYP